MYLVIKRVFDLVFSLICVLLFLPILFLISIILLLTGEGNIFYFQERVGYHNKQFNILKFATMLKNSPNIGNKTLTVRNDPRITKIGKYLRITKINELPQIINILKGDMSFVGPRPLILPSFYKYNNEVRDIIYLNKPGITGIGSLIFRDEEKIVSYYFKIGGNPSEYYINYIYPYKGIVEIWYYKNISFLTDFKILFLTFWSLFDSNSNLVYKFFKDLPPKPFELTTEGIKSLN